jgi:hypothetical protein
MQQHLCASPRRCSKLRFHANSQSARITVKRIDPAGAGRAGGAADTGDVDLVGHIAHEGLDLPGSVSVAEIEIEQTARPEQVEIGVLEYRGELSARVGVVDARGERTTATQRERIGQR